MTWLTRNIYLLFAGVVLLPLLVFILLVTLALGVGFSDEPILESIKLILLVSSYAIFYFFVLVMSVLAAKTTGSYGNWDKLPIPYFLIVLVVLLLW